MTKNIVMGFVLTVVWGTVSFIGYVDITDRMDSVSRQMYAMKNKQEEVSLKVSALVNDYLSLSDYIVYFEGVLNDKFDDVSYELSQLDELMTNDDFLFEEINNIKEEYAGVNAGLGVLTGYHVVGSEPVEEVIEETIEVITEVFEEEVLDIPEPIVYTCPKLSRSVNFADYIDKISFTRTVNVVIGYDILDGELSNVRIVEGKANSKLLRAINRYLVDAIPMSDATVTNCSTPFTIEV